MYMTDWCPYCARARSLLQRKGAKIVEIDIDRAANARTEMISSSGRRTVPQIFIGNRHIGGYDDLAALDAARELDPLLQPRSQGNH